MWEKHWSVISAHVKQQVLSFPFSVTPCRENSRMREILACEIQNREKFCSLNPESWALESWNTAQGIRNLTKRLESRMRVPLTKTGIQYVESESTVWSPESKTVLNSLISSYFSFALMNLRHNNTSMTKKRESID